MSLGTPHPHDNEMWFEDPQNEGAHAGFEGASKEHPAKPIAPEAEGSEHSEIETARKTVENGNREYRNKFKQLADDDSRQQLYDHQAAQQDDEAAQVEGLKSKAAKIIVDFQQRLPELEGLKQENPKLYQSLTATMQTLLAMAAKMFGEPEQVQKAEGPDDEPDFLDEIMAERTAKNPEFPEMVRKAEDSADYSKNIVYHGTANQFNSFEQKPGVTSTILGEVPTERHGFFFTPHKETARRYAASAGGKQGRVIHATLNMKNPLDLRQSTYNKNPHVWENALERLSQHGINRRWMEYGELWDKFDGEQGKHFVEAVKKMGHDGVLFEEDNHLGSESETHVVFHPHQIKIRSQEGLVAKSEDKLHGGAADDMEDVEFDPEQLKIGIEHELEHTQDRDIAEEIAKDHLAEDPAYYTKLATIEKAGLLEAGKTGRHHIILPVGSQIDASSSGTNKAAKIKVRDPETGKTKWRQVKAGMVMDDKGLPVSSRNQG